MKRHLSPSAMILLLAAVVCMTVSGPAAAWGPRARQAIALASINLVRNTFTAGEIVYEGDVIKGAAAGIDALGGNTPLNSDAECIDAVGLQIIILREAIRNGPGSYAAYRVGGLAALVSELMVPYGIVYNADEKELADQIQKDLEDQISALAYSPTHPSYQYIINHRIYFQDRRTFYYPDKEIITDDYKRGKGKNGLLRSAARSYFERSIEAVTDVWYTVLHIEPGTKDWRPSNRQMAEYYVDEIQFLLSQKKNFDAANRAYDLFQKYNPGLPMALVTVGDAYYALGTDKGKKRGVEEWDKAYSIPGEARDAASQRLSKHYIDLGSLLYKRASTPEGLDTDLDNALTAFKNALRYDLSNEVAATSVTDTTKAITARKQEYETQLKFLESAAGMVAAAERASKENDFGGALTSYRQALNGLQQVTPMFKDLSTKAREKSGEINNAIKGVIASVYESANASIQKGDDALLNGNVDDAVRFYSAVESIVAVIPAEAGSPGAQNKQGVIDAAQAKIDEAEIQRKRQAQAAQNPGTAGGAKVGAGGAKAGGATPPPAKKK